MPSAFTRLRRLCAHVNATLLAEGDAAGVGDALQTLFAAPRTAAAGGASARRGRLQPLFEALHAENHAADSADGPLPLWLARAVVWRLALIGRRDEAQTGRRARRGRQSLYTRWVVLMESNYLAQWPVSRYAERLGLSTERLNRMVRAEDRPQPPKPCCTRDWRARPAGGWCMWWRQCRSWRSSWVLTTPPTFAASSSDTRAFHPGPTGRPARREAARV